jgi:hypothetical protein
MVYVKVVLGVYVDWRTILGQQISNVLLYQLDRFVVANLLTPLETRSTPTTIPPILTGRP